MFYQQYTPHPALRNYIKCYWIMESDDTRYAEHKEKILPDGCMEMIFHYHNLYRQFKNGKEKVQSRNVLVGQLRNFIEISPSGKAGMIAIRFQPHGAYPFLRIPIHEFTEESVDLNLIVKDAALMQEMILNANSHIEKVSIVECFLLEQLKDMDVNDYRIQASVHQILQHQGNLEIAGLANKMNISSRQLERIFITRTGLSPKALSRIIRLQHTIQLIQDNQVKNFTELAHQAGYYDQAHFTREFKSFAGVNPSQYFAENYQYATFFSSGE